MNRFRGEGGHVRRSSLLAGRRSRVTAALFVVAVLCGATYLVVGGPHGTHRGSSSGAKSPVRPNSSTSIDVNLSSSVTPSSASAKPPSAKPPVTVPGGNQTCFPYPAKKANFVTEFAMEPGVTLAPRYLDEAKTLWQQQWPPAWATFAAPAAVSDPNQGIRRILFTQDGGLFSSGGTLKVKAADVLAEIDRTTLIDFGANMHESAHMITDMFAYGGSPKFYGEGVTDFIRFVARGEGDHGWLIVNESDPSYFDENGVWEGGYRPAARFLAWLTQHYDTSGGEYKKIHDLNALVVAGNRDWQGMIVQIFGRSYHDLFQAYRANPKINKHC